MAEYILPYSAEDIEEKLGSIDEMANDISELNSKLTDYIVEQGTSGIWTYRKWNSGIAECWGTPTTEELTMATSGNIFRSEPVYFNVPSFLLSVVSVNYNSHSANVIGLTNYGVLDVDNSRVGIRVQKSTNDSASVRFSAFLIGGWK